jgi:hypothetical protein
MTDMTSKLRNMTLGLALMVSAAPFMSMQAEAKSSFMEQCSALYKAGKADGSVADTVKWTDFMKTNCASLKAAAADAPAVDASAAKPKKTKKDKAAATMTDTTVAAPAEPMKKDKKAKKDAAAADPAESAANTETTPSGSFMQNCSAAWKAMKAADTVPAGMTWKDFVAAKCVVAATDPVPAVKAPKKKKADPVVMQQNETPPEPVAADNGPVKTMDKNGKPFTAGQLAAHARARACGLEWRTAKAAGQIPAGKKWPQYWSDCNTRMKTGGQ